MMTAVAQQWFLRRLPPTGAPVPLRTVLRSAIPARMTGPTLTGLLASRTGVEQWIGLNSGRAALAVSLLALGRLRPGCDEVIAPAYTSYSVAAAVVRAGFRLRLCDIDAETLGLSPKDLERVVTPKTLAIISHHLYGIPCRQEEIMAVAADHAVPVVEDAAQGMGLHCLSRPSWPPAQVLIFSLSRGKSLPAAGGGLIGTDWEELAIQCRRVERLMSASTNPVARLTGIRSFMESTLSSLFIHPSLYWVPTSIPQLKIGASIYDPSFAISPLVDFQQRLATRLLPRLGALQEGRRRTARRLRDDIASLRSCEQFWVVWPKREHASQSAEFLRLPVLMRHQSQRDRVVSELTRLGLGVSAGYPEALCDLRELRDHLAVEADCPVAREISRQLFTLPTHCWVTNRIHGQILEVLDRCSS